MKAHIEIRIRLDLALGKTLHDVLRHFARRNKGWKFPPKQSKSYQNHHGSPAGFVVCDSVEGLERAAVALANLDPKHPNSFRVTNIVPRNCSGLTLDQYNAIGKAFAGSFQRFLRQSNDKGNVEIVGPDVGLPEIIRATKCRHFFEAWLQTPTPTVHPSDIFALDRFTCAIFRYGSRVDLDRLARHLIEDRKWNSDSAVWVVRRIQAGLNVLAVDRRFSHG